MLLQLLLLGNALETESVKSFRLFLPLSLQNCCSRPGVMLWEWPGCANAAKMQFLPRLCSCHTLEISFLRCWQPGAPTQTFLRNQQMKQKKATYLCFSVIFANGNEVKLSNILNIFYYFALQQHNIVCQAFQWEKKRNYSAVLPSIKMRTHSYK